MTARPSWTPPATEGETPHARFTNLLARLLKVPKHEIDEQRESERVAKTRKKKAASD